MPGRELRESTRLKMQRAEERWRAMDIKTQPPAAPVQMHLTDVSLNIQQPPAPPQATLPAEQQPPTAPSEATPIQEPPCVEPTPPPPAPVLETVEQPVAPAEGVKTEPEPVHDRQEIDLLSAFVSGKKSPAQEWKEEMVKRTQERKEQPMIDPNIVFAERRVEERPVFYTNYPGLEMKEQYKVWTIEPPRDDTPVATPLHHAVNTTKVENFTNKIIGGDLAIQRLGRR